MVQIPSKLIFDFKQSWKQYSCAASNGAPTYSTVLEIENTNGNLQSLLNLVSICIFASFTNFQDL